MHLEVLPPSSDTVAALMHYCQKQQQPVICSSLCVGLYWCAHITGKPRSLSQELIKALISHASKLKAPDSCGKRKGLKLKLVHVVKRMYLICSQSLFFHEVVLHLPRVCLLDVISTIVLPPALSAPFVPQ